MKPLKIILIACAIFMRTNAQDMPANAASIPDSLKKAASVITYLYNMDVDVENLDKASIQVHKVFTVLNEEGKDALFFNEYSTKYRVLDHVEIRVYDRNGKQIGKYKKKDMSTVSVGEGLVDDGYLTYYRIIAPSYPITVDISYEKKIKSIFSLPDFRFIQDNEAVIESNYTARIPAEIPLRYKAYKINIDPVIKDEGKYKTYLWTVKNVPAIEDEK